jgi:hypothetical protein
MEVTPAYRDKYKAKYEESPGMKLELHVLRNYVDRLKAAKEKNGMLRRLVKALQQVEIDHEYEIKQLMI